MCDWFKVSLSLSLSLFLSLSLSHLSLRYTTKPSVTSLYPRLLWTYERMDKRDWLLQVSPDTPPRRPTRSFPCWRSGTRIGLSTLLMLMLPRPDPMLCSRSVVFRYYVHATSPEVIYACQFLIKDCYTCTCLHVEEL